MRLIDADKLMKYLESIFNEHKAESSQDGHNDDPFVDGESSAMHNVFEAISEQPTVDAQPVVHAHWIDEELELGEDFSIYKCSNCGEEFQLMDGTPNDNDYDYCPHCGARMDEVGK